MSCEVVWSSACGPGIPGAQVRREDLGRVCSHAGYRSTMDGGAGVRGVFGVRGPGERAGAAGECGSDAADGVEQLESLREQGG